MLDGTWIPVTAELGGTPMPEEALASMKLILDGDRYTAIVRGVTDEGTLNCDNSHYPKSMDILGTAGPNKGKTILAIYELNRDTLRICYDLSGTKRPMSFGSKSGNNLFLVRYKRQA